MGKITYIPKKFKPSTNRTIKRANTVLEEYVAQGFTLTLRQLYYQFVARGWIRNSLKSYKRLGATIGDARLAGRIDWSYIEDRTRNLMSIEHYDGPQDALDRLKRTYHVDLWANQKYRPEVWIEKDALVGVIEGVCNENDIPFFSCRGYTSLSEMWRASVRLDGYIRNEQTPYIIHFGDHDPSGIDMSRDICDRIQKTFFSDCEFQRVALNIEQVREYNPPPNPAKITDSRYKTYVKSFGRESWELDALDPPKFRQLIELEAKRIRDSKRWNLDVAESDSVKARLDDLSNDWESIASNKLRVKQLEEELSHATKKITALQKKRKGK